MARKAKLDRNMRYTPSGAIALQFTVHGQRTTGQKILPTEPASYDTLTAARAGKRRVEAHLEEAVNREATVGGFFERWTDVDDPDWGPNGNECPQRSDHTIYTYASHVRAFVAMFEHRTLASISDADLRAYRASASYTASQMKPIGTFLENAKTAGLRSGVNPAAPYAKKAGAQLAFRRRNKKGKGDRPPVPPAELIEAMLAHARRPGYPRGFYGWLLTGVRTGLRSGEIDGMEFEFLDGDVYDVQYQLHYRTRTMDIPKHDSRRKIHIPSDVRLEIDAARALAGEGERYIWLNSRCDPWGESARIKWWTKQVDGRSLCEIAGGITMYEATRHYWASWAVNAGGLSPYIASILMGHSDGGATLMEHYVNKDEDNAVRAAADAMRSAQQRKAA